MGSRFKGRAGRVAVAALAHIALVVLPIAGEHTSDSPLEARGPAASHSWRIVSTVLAGGRTQPCECAKRQFGAGPHRAIDLRATRQRGDLMADSGSLGEHVRTPPCADASPSPDGMRLLVDESLRSGEDYAAPARGTISV